MQFDRCRKETALHWVDLMEKKMCETEWIWIHLLQVCVWELQPRGHRLLETLKKHKATVTCIKIKSDDKECVSASSDGACIIWDIVWVASLHKHYSYTYSMFPFQTFILYNCCIKCPFWDSTFAFSSNMKYCAHLLIYIEKRESVTFRPVLYWEIDTEAVHSCLAVRIKRNPVNSLWRKLKNL